MTVNAAVAVIRDGKSWIVVIAENGTVVEHPFASERQATSWAKSECERRGLAMNELVAHVEDVRDNVV